MASLLVDLGNLRNHLRAEQNCVQRISQIMSDDRQHFIPRSDRFLLGMIQAGVVDVHSCLLGELLRKLEVFRRVRVSPYTSETQRSDHATAGMQRNEHERPGGNDPARITRSAGQPFWSHLPNQFGQLHYEHVVLPGLTEAQKWALVDGAHQICPYSLATRGNIEVTFTVA